MDVRTEREALALLEHALSESDWRLAQLLVEVMQATASSAPMAKLIEDAGAESWRLVWGLGELTHALGVDN